MFQSTFKALMVLLGYWLCTSVAWAAGDSTALSRMTGLISILEGESLKWTYFGVMIGAGGLLSGLLFWNASHLKTSVWISHIIFTATALLSLCIALFIEPMLQYTELAETVFLCVVRLQLVMSSVMVFALLHDTHKKQAIGIIFSALLGGVLGASILEFVWPVSAFLLINVVVLIAATLILGVRQFKSSSSKALVFHLIITIGMAYIVLALPDLREVAGGSYALFAFLQLFMLACMGAALCSSFIEFNTDRFGRLKRDYYLVETKLQKQQQLIQLLQTECQTLNEKIEADSEAHHQIEQRDHLKIKALEEMSQDIAQGMITYLKEIDHGYHQIMNETKAPHPRHHRMRAFAERGALLAGKVRDVMGFLQREEEGDEHKAVNASDLLRECLRICHDKIKRNGVELEIDSYENELWLKGRLTLLAQGYLGLLYNALEATEVSDVRRITIRLRRVQGKDGAWVELCVSNSGAGIPTHIKGKVFHAKLRDGLGSYSLGLSMAFGVFESYGGSLDLDTDSVATTVVARLPLYRKGEVSGLRLVG